MLEVYNLFFNFRGVMVKTLTLVPEHTLDFGTILRISQTVETTRLLKASVERQNGERKERLGLTLGLCLFTIKGNLCLADGQNAYRRWDVASYGVKMSSIDCKRSWEV